jgi:hypothetical protein
MSRRSRAGASGFPPRSRGRRPEFPRHRGSTRERPRTRWLNKRRPCSLRRRAEPTPAWLALDVLERGKPSGPRCAMRSVPDVLAIQDRCWSSSLRFLPTHSRRHPDAAPLVPIPGRRRRPVCCGATRQCHRAEFHRHQPRLGRAECGCERRPSARRPRRPHARHPRTVVGFRLGVGGLDVVRGRQREARPRRQSALAAGKRRALEAHRHGLQWGRHRFST